MFRNYAITALRNLVRNRIYAIINIVGLAVGFSAAILIALFVRDAFSYDTWIRGHERTYLLTHTIQNPGHTPTDYHSIWFVLADSLRLDFPSFESVAKVSRGDSKHVDGNFSLRHANVEANEKLYWADSNFFDVLPLPVFAGDPKTALERPDGIVLTRSIARKYFGRDNAVGETIEIDRQYPMRVTAIIQDLPSNTHLDTKIIASSLAAFSLPDRKGQPVYAYLRLARGASAREIEKALPAYVQRHLNVVGFQETVRLTPIADVHWHPDNSGTAMKPVDDPATVYALAAIGVLILVIACINFINLMTARSTRRALEVGIRKATGATRRDLMIQFTGESLLYAVLGMLFAIGLIELLLPAFNAYLDRGIVLNYWGDPVLLASLSGVTVIVGLLAGFYPAFLLAAFPPAIAVKKDVVQAAGLRPLRTALVVVQFSVLIGLIVATLVISRQTNFALNEGLRVDKDQVLLIETECKTAFPDRVRTLPGVRRAACSGGGDGLKFLPAISRFAIPGGTPIWTSTEDVDFDFFELYGLKPVAGRFFSRNYGADSIPIFSRDRGSERASAVINEAAARQLGFASPKAAIGQTVLSMNKGNPPMEIIGVVPDFSWDSIHALVPPSLYYFEPAFFHHLNVKLSGRDLPNTMQAIDSLWKEAGEPKPITVLFLDQEMQKLYLDITRQGELFGAFAGIALFLACLGLIGLAVATAERRTKEIGIRKAMGAKTLNILWLLTWQFAKPVLWANLIAWPVAGYLMNRWLHGFAYHIDLDPMIFVGASGAALVIALTTVAGHALLVARAKPVAALRYE